MYVYKQSEPGLWTVGDYESGKWNPESDHGSEESAVARVAMLNGGAVAPAGTSAKGGDRCAFPSPATESQGEDTGMTLRDYFAAKAMQSWISVGSAMRELNNPKVVKSTDPGWIDLVCTASYRMAEAMLAARTK